MIDVVSGSLSKGKDWAEIWLQSPEYTAITKEIEEVSRLRSLLSSPSLVVR